MKRYEGSFILKTSAKEETIKDIIDNVSAEIAAQGGKVETVQKMDKRPFARVANRRYSSGYYVNIIFNAPPEAIATLRSRFALNDDVFRVIFTVAPPPQQAKAA
ncbi:MAG: 30S ribosomal protein S6 [Verrucomicrobiia bacterium]